MNEAVEKVLAILDGFRMSDEITYSAYSALHDEISLLDDLLKEQEPKPPTIDGWISVKKRLPEEEDYKPCRDYPEGVVLWFNGFESGFGWYYTSTKEWSDSNDRGITNVTHWMPFPEEPKKTE